MLPDRKPDGDFSSFETWVCKAASWIGGTNPLCVDAKDHVCKSGADMQRARDEGAFPVRFWHGEGDQTPKEQRKARRSHKAAMKLNYPWRCT